MTAVRDPLWLLAGDNAMRRAMTWAVVFAALWAVLEVALGAALHTPFDILQIVWCRYAAHLSLCMVLWGWRRPTALWKTSRPASHIFRSLMMIIMPGAFALAMYRGASAEFVWSMFWISPALITGLASFLLKEHPPPVVILMSIAGFPAAAAIFGHLWPPSSADLVLALAVAGSFSMYVVMTRSLRDEAVEANMFYTALCPFLAIGPFLPSIWIWPSVHDAIVLATIGIVGFVALRALDNACRVATLWSSAGALFAQAFCVAALVSALRVAHLSSYALFGMAALAATIGFLWVRADRFAILTNPQQSRA